MDDSVLKRAAELQARARACESVVEILKQRHELARKQFISRLQIALERKTSFVVGIGEGDDASASVVISYCKEMFGRVVRRDILFVSVDRHALRLGPDAALAFSLIVPERSPLGPASRPDLSLSDAVRQAVEIVVETLAHSVAAGCRILPPAEAAESTEKVGGA